MNPITTLEELRDYFDSIPSDKWGTRLIEFEGKQCSMAHAGRAFNADWKTTKEHLQHLGVDFRVMVDENDSHRSDPKTAVLNYINLLIRMKNAPSTVNTGGV